MNMFLCFIVRFTYICRSVETDVICMDEYGTYTVHTLYIHVYMSEY